MTDNISLLLTAIDEYNNGDAKIDVKVNESLGLHSTFRIGGPAAVYAIPADVDSLTCLLSLVKEYKVRSYVIGKGSNILFDDAGFDGVVISTSGLNKVSLEGDILTAECGASLSACAVLAKENAKSGFECLFGIPGSVGGAVYMNAGAYGGEIKDVAVKTWYLDTVTHEICEISGDAHEFGYRESIFKKIPSIILKTEFKLKDREKTLIQADMDDYKARRIDKQPLEYPSAGSTFKRYPGRYTGQMIDESGLKGYSVGGAQVSEKHAGFVINTGNATSADVLALIQHIKDTIRKNYGIDIETEVIYVK